MSKFLKFIVHLVVICIILIAAALLLPPLAGVKTVMNDNSTAETNLPVGSVAYGKQTDAVNLKKGQKIIYTKNNQAYIYEISDVSEAAKDTYQVKDAYDKKAEERSVELSGDVIRLSFVVPMIAYAAIAVQSKEGLIVIGLGIIFLIILFILAELWRKDKKEMELETETKETPEETNVIPIEPEVAAEAERKEEVEAETETLEVKSPVEEKTESETEEISETEENSESAMETDETSYLQDTVETIVEGTAVLTDILNETKAEATEEETIVEESAIEETKQEETVVEEPAVEETEQEEVIVEEPVEEEPVEEVLRSPSLEELLKAAQAHGDHPEIIEDPDNKVTLLDYTNLF